MKLSSVFVILGVLMLGLALFAQPAEAQFSPAVRSMVAMSTQTATDTSNALEVPFNVSNLTVYEKVDSVSASDNLTIYVQVSGDGSTTNKTTGTWTDIDTLTQVTAAPATERKVVAIKDKYVRVIRVVSGSGIRIRSQVLVLGKP